MAKINPKDALLGKPPGGKKTPAKTPGRPKNEIECKRFTFYIPVKLATMIGDYAYWERQNASAVVTEALVQFFKGKKIKTRPPKTKSINSIMRRGKL